LEAFYNATLAATSTAPARAHAAAPGTINIDFLQSGRQFDTAPATVENGKPRMSKAARLEAFYNATLAATSTAPVRAYAAAPGTINIDFLRSGRQFDTAPASVENGEVGAVATKSRAARLAAFHKATLAAATVQAPVVPVLNVSFLRSGKQFGSCSARSTRNIAATFVPSGPKTSKFNRLHRYYNSTLSAHGGITPTATVSSDTMPPTSVNLDFLKSGGEFKPKPLPIQARFLSKAPGTPPHMRRSRAQKLEDFYQQTQEAVKAAGCAARAPFKPCATVTASTADHTGTNGSTPTMVNLDFLRSGLEFMRQGNATASREPESNPTTATDVSIDAASVDSRSARKSRHRRLADFYKATLSAAAEAKAELRSTETADAAKRRAQANVATPTMVNLKFLRSGLEFVRTGTTTVWAFSHEQGAFVPTKVAKGSAAGSKKATGEAKRGAARSRYSRLEDFYKATLAAQMPVRTKELAGPA
jgi:septum formation inhibitor MinC